jgi:hypothetical protein
MIVIKLKHKYKFDSKYFLVKEVVPYGYILDDNSIVNTKDVDYEYNVLGFIKCVCDKNQCDGLPEKYLTIGEVYPVFETSESMYGTEYSFIANGNIRRYMSFADNSPFIGKFEKV